MSSSTLPVLPLSFPLVLLPTARISIPVHRVVGEALLQYIEESETQPVIAAVPRPSPDSPSLHEWGATARIIRLVRPPKSLGRSEKQPYLLSLVGLSRVHLLDTKQSTRTTDSPIVQRVEYPPAEGMPSSESVATFKTAAFKLLDRLANDTANQSKRDTYGKISSMVDEVSDQRAPWMADVLVAGLNAEHADKLGESAPITSQGL